ncbi:hypothetical protein BZ163_15090 [Pseudomonas sp. VI4.1]|nr:hypothetical protein BZ163_15090 [Pseudomonas sp. VI4.1]
MRQVANEPWDPSVQSLVAFPAALVMLGQDPAWVQRVGDAFLAQPNAVMDSVQRLRRQAQAAGHLESNAQQRVTVQPAVPAPAPAPTNSTVVVQQPAATQTIIIEPAQPQTVYVPSYNPSVVYGTWAYPSYPPAYYPPPPGYYLGTALAAGLAFGAGVAIVDSLWGDCDWGLRRHRHRRSTATTTSTPTARSTPTRTIGNTTRSTVTAYPTAIV